MKIWKEKYIKYVLVCMIAACLAIMPQGCRKAEEEAGQVTISVMIRDFNRDRRKYIDKLLEERENIHIEWTIIPAADYDMVFEQKANADELPDLFETNMEMTEKYAEMGSFIDFSEYLDQMPNLQKWMDQIPAIYNDTVDGEGHLYCITTFNTRGQVPRQSIYRKDIFDKENLKAPETVNELYEDLLILKDKYPGCIPVGNRWGAEHLVSQIAVLYRSNTGFFLDNDSLTYEYGPATLNFKKAMRMLQKFYQADLIDPNFATISDEQFVKEITEGEILFLFSEYLCCLNTEEQRDWNGNGKEKNPQFEMVPIEPPDTENGNGLIEVQMPTSGGSFAIGVNSRSENIDKIISFLDAQYSDEVIELVNWGIEGETYTVESGRKKWLIGREERQELGLDARSGVWVPIDQDCSDRTLDEKDQEYIRKANADISHFAFYEPKKRLVFAGEDKEKVTAIQRELTRYCQEQYMEFITGKKNMEEEWDEFVKKLEQIGYKQVLEIYRKAYERLPEEQKGLDKNLGL